MQARDEERRLALDGVVWGLERALDIINIVEEKQGQPASHPVPRAHSEQPSQGGKIQKSQNKVDKKLPINREEKMSEKIDEDQKKRIHEGTIKLRKRTGSRQAHHRRIIKTPHPPAM